MAAQKRSAYQWIDDEIEAHIRNTWIEPALEALYHCATQAMRWSIESAECAEVKSKHLFDSAPLLADYCERIEAIDGWWHHVDFSWPQHPGLFIGPTVGRTSLSVAVNFSRMIRDEVGAIQSRNDKRVGGATKRLLALLSDYPLKTIWRESLVIQTHLDADYEQLHLAAVAKRKSGPEGPTIKIRVSLQPPMVLFEGREYKLTTNAAHLLNAIVGAQGDWISSSTLRPFDANFRGDRALKSMPPEIRKLVESATSKGFRIKLHS